MRQCHCLNYIVNFILYAILKEEILQVLYVNFTAAIG